MNVYVKIMLSFIVALLTVNGYSQTEVFDIVSFTPPQSWKRDTQEGSVSFTTSRGNVFCVVGLYNSRPLASITENEYIAEWNEFVNTPYNLNVTPVVNRSQINGWTVFSGSAEIDIKRNGTYTINLISFAGDGMIISALVNSNGTLFDKEAGAFLSSIKMVKEINSYPENNDAPLDDANEIPAVSAKAVNPDIQGIAGAWVGFESGNYLYGITSSDYINNHNNYGTKYSTKELALKWRVFLKDGTYYEGMPKGGLINFNKKDKVNDFAGSFTTENNIATAKLDRYSSAVRTFVLYPPSQLKYLNKYVFVKCQPVDGLTLNGTYMSVDMATIAYYLSLNKPNPTISFTADGHFTDDNFIGEYSPNTQSGPGSGTYAIENFTIVLKYTDGRIIHRSFIAYLDEDPSASKVFYIGNRDIKLAR